MTGFPRTFMGLDGELASPEHAGVVIVPVPYAATASGWPGAGAGPAALLKASVQIEDCDLELDAEPVSVGVHVAEPLEPGQRTPEAMVEAIRKTCLGWHEKGKFVFALGGEHTVAVGAARAAAERFPGLSFLQIDAHSDLRKSYQGSALSHACTARRLWELGPVVAVGIRSASSGELTWARNKGAPVFTARRIWAETTDGWIDEVVHNLGERVYVTFDVDGLDPSVMLATGTPEPGGLSYRQVIALLRAVAEQCEVVACDLCELAPAPGLHAAEFTAARLAYKMIGYFATDILKNL
jgi:agmatinase